MYLRRFKMFIMKSIFSLFFSLFSILISAQNAPGLCSINLGPDVIVCNHAKFTLNPHPVTGNYFWSGSLGLDCYNCPSPKVSGLTTGAYQYFVAVTAPDGCVAFDTLLVTVINGEAPQYEIAASREICAGDTIALGGQGFSGNFYNWFSNPVGFVDTSANPKAKPNTPTTYYLSVSNSTSNCNIPTLDSVTVTPVALTLQITPIDTVLCLGKSATFLAVVNPAGQKIVWLTAPGLQTNTNGTIAEATPLASAAYTASATLGGCTRTRQVFISVDSLPGNLAIDPATDTICKGETLTLTSHLQYDSSDYPNLSFLWSPALGAISPLDKADLNIRPDQSMQYRRVTRNGACTDTAFTRIEVIPAAQLEISPAESEICPGDSVKLKISYTPGVSGIKWSPAAGLSCTNCDSTWAYPAVSQTYTVSGTYKGCPAGDTARINLKPLAPLQFPQKQRLCPGQSVRLNELYDTAATYTWTSTHPGFGMMVDTSPVFAPTQSAWYYVTANNGCLRHDSIQITLVQEATLQVEGDTICKNDKTTLTAITSLAGQIQWKNDLTGQLIGSGPTIEVSPEQTTTYTIVYTYGGTDSCQIVKQVAVKVEGETPVIVFPAVANICADDSLILNTGPQLPLSMYTWSANPADPSLNLQALSAFPKVSPGQNTTYTVTASNGNCSVTKMVDVTVAKATLKVSAKQTICAGDPVTITAAGVSTPSGSYEWDSGETTPSITKSPTTDTAFVVTYVFNGGKCELKDTAEVDVVKSFSATIQSVPDTNQLDVGTSATLIAVVSPPSNLSNYTFVWEEITVDTKVLPADGESVDVVPSSNDTVAGEVRYRVTITSPEGCVRVAEKVFKLIFPLVRFPNAFTPNGDGDNDRFEMIVPQGLAFVERMEIYNRWGQKVFQSTAPDAAWDGMAGGKEAPTGVYAYRVWWRRGDGALQMQAKGDITLLR